MRKNTAFLLICVCIVLLFAACSKSSSPGLTGTWEAQSVNESSTDSTVHPITTQSSYKTFVHDKSLVLRLNANNTYATWDSTGSFGSLSDTGTYATSNGALVFNSLFYSKVFTSAYQLSGSMLTTTSYESVVGVSSQTTILVYARQ